jgi:hypothetical protein
VPLPAKENRLIGFQPVLLLTEPSGFALLLQAEIVHYGFFVTFTLSLM